MNQKFYKFLLSNYFMELSDLVPFIVCLSGGYIAGLNANVYQEITFWMDTHKGVNKSFLEEKMIKEKNISFKKYRILFDNACKKFRI